MLAPEARGFGAHGKPCQSREPRLLLLSYISRSHAEGRSGRSLLPDGRRRLGARRPALPAESAMQGEGGAPRSGSG